LTVTPNLPFLRHALVNAITPALPPRSWPGRSPGLSMIDAMLMIRPSR